MEKAEKRRRRFGKTKDGNWVSETDLNKMTTILGYPEILAAKALRHTNNDINLAIDAINANPELLLVDDEDDPNSMVEFHSKFQNSPKFLQISQRQTLRAVFIIRLTVRIKHVSRKVKKSGKLALVC